MSGLRLACVMTMSVIRHSICGDSLKLTLIPVYTYPCCAGKIIWAMMFAGGRLIRLGYECKDSLWAGKALLR